MTINNIGELEKDSKIVAHARFNKVKRLRRQSAWSLFSISILSFTLIIAAILERTNNISELNLFIFSLPIWYFSISSSIFILVISVSITKSQHDVQINHLYSSGCYLIEISRELGALQVNDPNHDTHDYKELLKRYNKIIQSNDINHDEVDYRIAKAENNKKKVGLIYHIWQWKAISGYLIINIIASLSLISLTLQIQTTPY